VNPGTAATAAVPSYQPQSPSPFSTNSGAGNGDVAMASPPKYQPQRPSPSPFLMNSGAGNAQNDGSFYSPSVSPGSAATAQPPNHQPWRPSPFSTTPSNYQPQRPRPFSPNGGAGNAQSDRTDLDTSRDMPDARPKGTMNAQDAANAAAGNG